MRNLQERILAAGPAFGSLTTAKALLARVRGKLLKAHADDKLCCGQGVILKHLRLVEDGDTASIFGDELGDNGARRTPFDRANAARHLVRSDGAWLHFTITVRQAPVSLELLAYSFELVLPESTSPGFVRFDLNLSGHANDEREIRSHVHPGNDDLLLPAPVMSPDEVIDVLLWRLGPRDASAPRAG